LKNNTEHITRKGIHTPANTGIMGSHSPDDPAHRPVFSLQSFDNRLTTEFEDSPTTRPTPGATKSKVGALLTQQLPTITQLIPDAIYGKFASIFNLSVEAGIILVINPALIDCGLLSKESSTGRDLRT